MDAYIYDAVRTPRGSIRKNGSLHEIEQAEGRDGIAYEFYPL